MHLSTYQIILAIAPFLSVAFILIKSTYTRYEKEYGVKTWKLSGLRTGYFRVMVLLSIAITVVVMLILKSTILA